MINDRKKTINIYLTWNNDRVKSIIEINIRKNSNISYVYSIYIET